MRSRWPLFLLLVTFLPLTSSAVELPPTRMVVDLLPGTVPASLFEFDPKSSWSNARGSFLVLDDRLDGDQLWFADAGSPAPRLLLESCPDLRASSSSSLEPLGFLAEHLLFSAGCFPRQLWTSDGTVAGTQALRAMDNPFYLGELPGERGLLFGTSTRDFTPSLWVTDGTSAGTEPIRPLAPFFNVSSPLPKSARLGVRWVFAGLGSEHGGELWESDGTPSGTRLVADLNPGAEPSTPNGFVALSDSVVLFFADDAVGHGLWRTDGTAAGTFRLLRLASPDSHSLLRLGSGKAFLLADAAGGVNLITTDGTPNGTRSIVHPPRVSLLNAGRTFVVFGNRAFWTPSVNDGRLFSSDGTAAGFRELPVRLESPFGRPFSLTPWGVAFLGIQGTTRADLWLADGTAAVRKLASSCRTEPCSGSFLLPDTETTNPEFLFFEGPRQGNGALRLWRSNGTPAGTAPVVTLSNAGPVEVGPTLDLNRTANGSFIVRSGTGYEWYSTDGTAAGTDLRLSFAALRNGAGSNPTELTPLGDRLVFFANGPGSEDLELYATDGTAQGTERLGNVTARATQTELGDAIFPLGSRAFVLPENHALAAEDLAYVTDGTSAGTEPLTGVSSAGNFVWIHAPGVLGNTMLVVADQTLYSAPLGSTSLTPIKTLGPQTSSIATPDFVTLGSHAYFLHVGTFEDPFNTRIWRTDGTTAGTTPLAEVPGFSLFGVGSSLVVLGDRTLWISDLVNPARTLAIERPTQPTVAMNRLYFLGNDRSLWVFDGQSLTRLARNVLLFSSLVPYRDGIAFVAFDESAGAEPWFSNGTVAGTRRLVDLWPGPSSSTPGDLKVLGDRLFFRATDPGHGSEVWVTDGTVAGTSRLTDLAPGDRSARPHDFVRQGDELVFVADDGVSGSELWAVPFDAVGEPLVTRDPEPVGVWLRSPEVPGFRFQVLFPSSVANVPTLGRLELGCLKQTVCVSGAVAGRTEVLLRVVGPKPNGFLWPTLVKLTSAPVEIWIEQEATGDVRYYELAGARPDFDELPALFDRTGFRPSRSALEGSPVRLGDDQPPPAGTRWLTSPQLPGFRVAVQLGGGNFASAVANCLGETLCAAGAVPGRTEVLVRVVGPRPNGFLWPTVARFTTAAVDVWIEQLATGARKHYRLAGAAPDRDDLTGLFDRLGFQPVR
ncbi:MAG: hypothetical protein SF066_22305 [Thermoanaerobaculia bacterium]|nr:hypothetical protein [Thermoanaerobaculia bacterium]